MNSLWKTRKIEADDVTAVDGDKTESNKVDTTKVDAVTTTGRRIWKFEGLVRKEEETPLSTSDQKDSTAGRDEEEGDEDEDEEEDGDEDEEEEEGDDEDDDDVDDDANCVVVTRSITTSGVTITITTPHANDHHSTISTSHDTSTNDQQPRVTHRERGTWITSRRVVNPVSPPPSSSPPPSPLPFPFPENGV